MNRLFFVFLFFVFAGQLFANPDSINLYMKNIPADELIVVYKNFQYDEFNSVKTHALIASGNFGFGSDAINASFVSRFYMKDKIELADKDLVSKTLKSTNRIGLNASTGFTYYQDLKRSNLIFRNCLLVLSVKNRQWVDAQFSQDAFEFLFRGNAPFAGKTAHVGPANFSQLTYNQFEAGLLKFGTILNGSYQVKVTASLLQGNRFNRANATIANVFTEQTGQYIDARYAFKVDRSDTASGSSIGRWNGTGASFSIGTEYQKRSWKFALSVEDLGNIRFNNEVVHYTADSSIHFAGVVLQDLFNSKTQAAAGSGKIDSLYQLLIPRISDEAFTVKLPFLLKASVSYKKYTIGFWNQFNSSAIPFIYLNAKFIKYVSDKNLQLFTQPQLAYGGYGTIHIGCNFGVRYKSFGLMLATDDLQVILPSKANGMSATLKTAYFF